MMLLIWIRIILIIHQKLLAASKPNILDGIARVGEQRLLVLLNLEQVLNRNEIQQLERFEE